MAAPLIIPKINYVSFDDAITHKYGIIIRNWPLKAFVSPGKMNSASDLEVLYYAFMNDVTTFYKMSPPELEVWREERTQKRLAQTLVQTASLLVPMMPDPAASSSTPTSPPIRIDTSHLNSAPDSPANANTASVSGTPAPHLATVPAATAEGNKRPYEAVLDISGESLVAKKPRRIRRDAGKKRGLNKRSEDRIVREAQAASTRSSTPVPPTPN